ncbi:neurotrophin-3-like [Tubulanus polymorphus]|uniref:neurotrophin-3-like n=1 Tax=Tubulanus polymorphus TaxID=672921 RepID=UPI003DA40BB2
MTEAAIKIFVVFIIILSTCWLAGCLPSSIRHRKAHKLKFSKKIVQNRQKSGRNGKQLLDEATDDDFKNFDPKYLPYMSRVFVLPLTPSGDETDSIIEASALITNKTSTAKPKMRTIRSINSNQRPFKVPVCETREAITDIVWSKDLWGHDVRVAKYINNAGVRNKQIFYETFCADQSAKTSCRGIDKRKYDSQCITRSVWAYAQVITSLGEKGWSIISIRGSCNCALSIY